jgi:predicted pyridoxine 5'-phosphate oxidase superfamily flavin-nucleotide-binding protein
MFNYSILSLLQQHSKSHGMARNYLRTLIGGAARRLQEEAGSRGAYARMEAGADYPDQIGAKESEFIAARDSFYIASITENGWPYVQHRGGPPGFLKSLPDNRLAFADYQGNKQYLSVGNMETGPRVSLFLMDYPDRRRLKIIGNTRHIELDEDPEFVTSLMSPEYKAAPERAIIIDVIGFDWNCPQHITPRFTEEEIKQAIGPLTAELDQLRAEVGRLRALLPTAPNMGVFR